MEMVRDIEALHSKRGWKQELAEVFAVSPSYIGKLARMGAADAPAVSERVVFEICRRVQILPWYFDGPEEEIDDQVATIEDQHDLRIARRWVAFLVSPRSVNQDGIDSLRLAVAALNGVFSEGRSRSEDIKWATEHIRDAVEKLPVVRLSRELSATPSESEARSLASAATALLKDITGATAMSSTVARDFDRIAQVDRRFII